MSCIVQIIFWLSIGALLYSYLGYPFVIRLLSRLFGRKVRRDETFRPTVAVVIPAYNEEKVIRSKIINTLSLDYPEHLLSIWVGSDKSTDATDAIVKGIDDPRVHLRVAPQRGGKTSTINALIPLIDAEIIVITDADIMLETDSILKMVRSFSDDTVGGVCGSTVHIAAQKMSGREEKMYRSFESYLKELESDLHSTISAFGSFYAFRKKAFRPLPPNAYSNDDVLIPMDITRQGWRVIFDPESRSSEQVNQDVETEFRRRIRIGAGNFQAFFWLIDFLNPLRGWTWFCYISHKVMRWFSPFFIILLGLSSALLTVLHGGALYVLFFSAGLAMVVTGLSFRVAPLSFTKPLYYFLSMNVAILFGFFRFLTGINSATWSRTERSGQLPLN